MIFQKKVTGLSEGALSRFVLQARRAAGLPGNVNILLTSSGGMRALNLRFRGKNKSTDVLSFTVEANTIRTSGNFAGEIAISAEIAAQNAIQFGHSTAAEVKVLVLHGILHLAGMDHERDNGEMARKEAKLRRVLKLPSTLTERAHSEHSSQAGRQKLQKNKRRRVE